MDYDTLTFDGLHISLADLKKAIIQKKMGKNNDFDLQVTNAQTKEGNNYMWQVLNLTLEFEVDFYLVNWSK